METIQAHLYDYPKYYDLVFNADCSAEFHFLDAAFARYAKRPVNKVFEAACGTGRMLFKLARAGYKVAGLDLNPRAVEFCNARLRKYGYPGDVFVGDMADFRVKRPYDASFSLINSFRHLSSDAQARDHLQCMSDATAKGGLFVLAMHLSPTVGEPISSERWAARKGNLAINTHMWIMERDLRRRNELLGITFDIYTPLRQFRISDTMDYRMYTARQMQKLIESVPSWELIAVHDFAYDIDNLVEIDGETEDIVYVLRKR